MKKIIMGVIALITVLEPLLAVEARKSKLLARCAMVPVKRSITH